MHNHLYYSRLRLTFSDCQRLNFFTAKHQFCGCFCFLLKNIFRIRIRNQCICENRMFHMVDLKQLCNKATTYKGCIYKNSELLNKLKCGYNCLERGDDNSQHPLRLCCNIFFIILNTCAHDLLRGKLFLTNAVLGIVIFFFSITPKEKLKNGYRFAALLAAKDSAKPIG